MTKKEKDDFEMLFEETPVAAAVKAQVKKREKKVKTISLDGVGSLRLVGELIRRHKVDMQVVGFWGLLAAIAWIKLG